jgi:hypothetical protein
MVVKFNKSADARVFMHAELYQLMIYAARKNFCERSVLAEICFAPLVPPTDVHSIR